MRVELFKQMESGLPRCLAPHALPSMQSLEPRQRLLNDIGQLIVGERAVLFESVKHADAQQQRRHSAAGTIKLNRHASLPARSLTPRWLGDQPRAALAGKIRPKPLV